MTNPWAGDGHNLTVTFWVKMDATIETDVYRHVVKVLRWVIAYNGKKKDIKAFIAFHGQNYGKICIILSYP